MLTINKEIVDTCQYCQIKICKNTGNSQQLSSLNLLEKIFNLSLFSFCILSSFLMLSEMSFRKTKKTLRHIVFTIIGKIFIHFFLHPQFDVYRAEQHTADNDTVIIMD